MRQFVTIASNAFMELVRQPIFLILMTVSASFIVFISSIYYFSFGDDPKLVKDGVLAIMLLAGLFGAVLSASASLAHEIRTGTALAVLAKPVGRTHFLLGKYVGLAGALTLLTLVNGLAALLASRMAFDAYGSPDVVGLRIFYGFIVGSFALGGLSNYFLRRPFVPDAVFFQVAGVILAFVIINFISKEWKVQQFGAGVDWRLVRAAALILFALWILAAVALACSTRFEMIPTLAICSAVFLLGLMSDYLFGRAAAQGAWWGTVAYNVIPNWQLFWLSDALVEGKTIPWAYVGKAFGYVICYLGAALAVGLALFEDRELS
ncbi:MAG TPA: ABC transporter permease subunit [Methylomirabilota bacterium]|nr:ABC transporter permease subunit [Methylomirabilota bacterium]